MGSTCAGVRDIGPQVTHVPKLTYGSYLCIDDLLSLQRPRSDPPHHDEMLFIVIHQVYELWFRQLLHEIEAAMRSLDADDLLRAQKHFRRIHTIQRLLEQQVDILETMTPQEFNAFRSRLDPASGFQSAQFREIESLREVVENLDVKPAWAGEEVVHRREREDSRLLLQTGRS